MDIRRLKNLPTMPLDEDVITCDRGFSFTLAGVDIWFDLLTRKEYRILKKNFTF